MIKQDVPLFTHALAIDWSANNKPKKGKDSIWLAEVGPNGPVPPINFFTRAAVTQYVKSRVLKALKSNERLIIGFDFAFGYPAGLAKAMTGEASWKAVWKYLGTNIQDSPNNQSNRYEVAGRMNTEIGLDEGPFWGHHKTQSFAGLSPKSPKDLPLSFPNKRIAEKKANGAQSAFKLAYPGAVGSQTLLGIAALQRLIADPALASDIAVWPFETNLAGNFSKPITFAEIYPSSHKFDKGTHSVLDAAQVMAVSRDLYRWNQTGALEDKLSAFGLSDIERQLVIGEEGWILGQ